jgi:hypothetical protein
MAPMTKHPLRLVALSVSLLLLAVAPALARPVVVRVGNLILVDNGGISPRKLPRHEKAPISATIDGTIKTADGSHPPALKEVIVSIDRTIELDGTGLPACRRGQIEARTTAEAKQACRGAIVGSGEGVVEVEFEESEPFSAKGPIVLFNGGERGGKTLLLIHAYVDVPVPTAVLATVELTHIHRGRFGLHAVAKIPPIAGGAGSPTHFLLRIGRRYTYRSEPRSYLTASCPTGNYYTEGDVYLTDGTHFHTYHPLPCTPEG